MPDIPSSINSGDYATIQLEYMALEDSSNVTHYACSDVVFVEESVFKVSTLALSCFNATDNDYYSYSDFADEDATSTTATTGTAATTATTTQDSTSATSSASSSSSGIGATMKTVSTIGAGALVVFVLNLVN
ncbi:unnamed protein product [Ambrosiozyma monospora]|uniref:Unnamed protein product n=1 Tax=Ambrosiozyma monospora TaxID=43982 RepID=A0ACB5U5K9_AMBMO|nr:unnamed protein product [Ambrosiozyma monospora]